MSQARSSEPSPVELEPVTCWPLIIGAVGFVCVGLFAVAGVAAWSHLFPPAKPAVAIAVPVEEKSTTSVRTEPIELPPPPEKPIANERVVKVRREVIDRYVPLPPVRPQKGSAEILKLPPPAPAPRPPMEIHTVALPSEKFEAAYAPKPPERTEELLREELWKHSRQIDLGAEKDAAQKMFDAGQKLFEERQAIENNRGGPGKKPPSRTRAIEELLKGRSDLHGLPMQDEKSCQSSRESGVILGRMSAEVRRMQARAGARRRTADPAGSGAKTNWDVVQVDYLQRLNRTSKEDLYRHDPGAILLDEQYQVKSGAMMVGPLEQMFQTESPPVRGELVKTLASIKTEGATQALARRAVFDLSPDVRRQAVKALGHRTADEVRPVLLAALRHPWAPAADHAALALAELDDKEAIPALRKMLDAPSPNEPFADGSQWKVCEVVRVQHLANCLLCHPPSLSAKDPVFGSIPTPGQPLPVNFYSRRRTTDKVVRADVVYFRQDFSAMHKVDKPNKWPEVQRFDYLVRTRELTDKEVKSLQARKEKDKPIVRPNYPQRQAVQYALYALAGKKTKENGKSD
jgi:hypothetical protein